MTDSTKCTVFGCPEPATAKIRAHGTDRSVFGVCAAHASSFAQFPDWDLVDDIPHGIEIEL